MKWGWLIFVVLFLPVSVQAGNQGIGTQADGTWNPFGKGKGKPPDASRFVVVAASEINHVRAKVRVFFDRAIPVKKLKKARCGLLVNRKEIPDMRDYFIYGSDGVEVWFPHLKKNDLLTIGLFWDQHFPTVRYATIEAKTADAQDSHMWFDFALEKIFQDMPQSRRERKYRELSLEDVCRTYTSQAIATGY